MVTRPVPGAESTLPADTSPIIIFRYDDYSSISPSDFEGRLFGLFRRHGVPLTVGVIPYVVAGSIHDPSSQQLNSLTESAGRLLRSFLDTDGFEAALHGYSHQTVSVDTAAGYTEFAGVSLSEQLYSLNAGRDLLERALDSRVETFIPPWNTYDFNTIRALEQADFMTLSANVSGPVELSSRLCYLPATTTIPEVQSSIYTFRRSLRGNGAVVVLMHAVDFSETDPEHGALALDDLDHLLAWISSQGDIRTLTMKDTVCMGNDFGARRCSYYSWLRTSYMLPETIRKEICPPYYPAFCQVKKRYLLAHALLVVCSASLFFLSLVMARFVMHGSPRELEAGSFSLAGPVATAALLIVAAVYTLRYGWRSFRRLLVLALILGACVGTSSLLFVQ